MRLALLLVLHCFAIASATDAAVLCRTKSGSVKVRDSCKKKETLLDPAQLGLVGPKGDKGDPGDPGAGPLGTCPPDSALVGTTCVDKYEASAWRIPAENTTLIDKVKSGTATQADLSGATQIGCTTSRYGHVDFPATFPATGNWSEPIYAASIAGVLPTACITWFQAEQACALAGKRLVTNQEWQRAAAGTPDPGGADDGTTTCVTNSSDPTSTGARAACVSRWGTFDMVGNVHEWTEDWGDKPALPSTNWTTETALPGDDTCWAGGPGGGANAIPASLLRGGSWRDGVGAGPLAAQAWTVDNDFTDTGFRCAR